VSKKPKFDPRRWLVRALVEAAGGKVSVPLPLPMDVYDLVALTKLCGDIPGVQAWARAGDEKAAGYLDLEMVAKEEPASEVPAEVVQESALAVRCADCGESFPTWGDAEVHRMNRHPR
jgi:hypothetical protein